MWTHLDEQGRPRMVDVSGKTSGRREAWATGFVQMPESILTLLSEQAIKKGNPMPIAELAGIQGAKATSAIIPLCHTLRLDSVDVMCTAEQDGVRVDVHVCATEATGVEMEALTAVSVAALTLYDMCKGVDKGMIIKDIRLLKKTGGKSGTWTAEGVSS